MTTAIEGVPEALVGLDVQAAAVHFLVDEELYPLPAIYGAAYVFIDRCYVFLDRPEPARVRVVLAARSASAEPDVLRALVGEFANELLSCAFRHQIAQDNRVLIETATMQALAGAMGQPSLDDLAKFDFSDQGFDDPLGIAMSWEEKHGKKSPASGTGGEP